jgi:hypothetical protein
MTEKQIRTWIPMLVEYEREYAAFEECRARVTRKWKDMVAELIEFGAEEGDQERIFSVYRSEGHPISGKLRSDVMEAFRSAGIMRSKKATQGRKSAITKMTLGLKGYGKKAAERINEVQEQVDKDRKLAAKQLLLSEIRKLHFTPIGKILRDNYDVLSWADVWDDGKKYEENWHLTFDPIIAKDKQTDEELNPKRKKASEG